MSIPGSVNPLFLGAAGQATGEDGYQIERSLRFNSSDSAYCGRSVSSAGSRTTWTWAGWVKKCRNGAYQSLFTSSRSGFETLLLFDNSDRLYLYNFVSSSFAGRKLSTSVYRDPSAWYHVVAVWDSTNATAADRCRLYVNGVRLTAFDTSTDPGPSEQTQLNDAYDHQIGNYVFGGSSYYLNGYLADIHFIDGQALDPSSFTEVSATTGQLVPIEYTGTFTGNSSYLKFDDNSAATATTLGKDSSGLGNNWTPNNLSVTAGSGNDSLVDTPTSYGTDTGAGGEVRGNYATLNPLGTAGAIPTNGNLSVSSSSTVGNRISTFFLTSGKWYWEGVGYGYVGAIVGRGGEGWTGSVSGTGSKAIGWWPLGPVYWDGGDNGGGTTYTSTDVIGVALDMDAGNVKFYKNGSLTYTITFGSGTVPNLSTGVFPAYNNGSGSSYSVDLNFGQRPFAYTAPSGFKALCDTNLPAPVVAKPSEVMDVVLYTGNGSTDTISGLAFSPDLVWLKGRSVTSNHGLYDIVRGASNRLISNATSAEGVVPGVTAFNSDGFDRGTAYNNLNETFVAWAWDAGTSTVTNTQGSITSQVRANASAGFSIVKYTTVASTNSSIGHGLNVAPKLLIVRYINNTSGWFVYHAETGAGNYLTLESTGASASLSSLWNDTAPTSSVFSVGTAWNQSVDTIAYCFAPVEGYSAFGSYTGNGSTDGVFTYLGFLPKLILIKRTDTTSNWTILDTSRLGYNVDNNPLFPNLSNAEGTTDLLDINSNGFKLRTTDASVNANTGTYIFAAWASNPFQYSRAR